MSFQLTILKVLAGQADGYASHLDVTKSVALLMSSGPDWSQRMKRLAARAPGLCIFSSKYVLRDTAGWQITDAGRAYLALLEAPAPDLAFEAKIAAPTVVDVAPPQSNVIVLVDHQHKRRPRAAA